MLLVLLAPTPGHLRRPQFTTTSEQGYSLHTLPPLTYCCVVLCVYLTCSPPQDIKFNVHAHPTLSEVLDELFKQAHVDGPAAATPAAAKAGAKQPVAA